MLTTQLQKVQSTHKIHFEKGNILTPAVKLGFDSFFINAGFALVYFQTSAFHDNVKEHKGHVETG